jgi:hypothetical protein
MDAIATTRRLGPSAPSPAAKVSAGPRHNPRAIALTVTFLVIASHSGRDLVEPELFWQRLQAVAPWGP